MARRDESRVGLEHQMGDLSELQSCCKESRDAAKFYRKYDEVDFHFGPTFLRMQDVQIGPPHQATYNFSIPDTLVCMPYNCQSEHFVHPVSLDVFQSSSAFLGEDTSAVEGPYMPVSIQEIIVAAGMFEALGFILQAHATSAPPDAFSQKKVVRLCRP